jgi:hypothetical protein
VTTLRSARYAARPLPDRHWPASLLASLQADMPDPDRHVVADRGICSMLLETYTEALRTSAFGWIDDAMAF